MNSIFSLGGLLRRPESGAFLGLLGMFVFFTIFGGLSFLTVGSIGAWMNTWRAKK